MDRVADRRDNTIFRGSDTVQTRRLVFMDHRKVRAMEFAGSGARG